MLRFFFSLLLVLLLALAALAAHSWYHRPFDIRIFFERVFLQYALEDPERLSELRILEQFGLDGHMDDLTEASPARAAQRAERARQDLATLLSYDRGQLTASQQLSYDILEWYLNNAVAGARWLYHDYPVNQLFGVQNGLPEFMLNIHQVSNRKEAHAYILRLSKFDEKFAQVLEGLRLREARGVLPPRFMIDKVLAEMRGLIEPAPADNLLCRSLRHKLDGLKDLADDRRELLLEACRAEVEYSVYPAYRSLIEYFQELQPKVDGNHGVWKLPDGPAYYAYLVRLHTTTALDPETIHRIGLEEVARIQTEMDRILAGNGYPIGSIGERMARLGSEPRFLYPNSDAGRQDLLADFQTIIDDIDRGLDPYFTVRPKSGLRVERIPAFKEQTAPQAYYNPPAFDGSRPGIFYVNLRDTREIKRFGMRTLAYHEAVPGHHFQLSVQQELSGVPTFRRILPFTAYSEGWALYAEQLAKELGYLEDPLDELGRLRDEMFRAVRLVVDTGLHHRRWTREQAIAYMQEKTGLAEADVVAEVERYLVMPGQALAYKIGMIRLLQLRDHARAELGNRFDMREFHDVVLKNGAMPLGILEEVVERWIERRRV